MTAAFAAMLSSHPSRAFVLALFVTAAPAAAFGQDTLSLSSGSAVAGGAVALNLSLSALSGSAPAGLQWTLTYTAGNVAYIGAAAGSSAAAANKTITCFSSGGSYTCELSGMNGTLIPNGVVAVINVTMTSSAVTTPIGLTNLAGADAAGSPISMTGAGGTMTLPAPLPALSGLSCSPTSLNSGSSSTCTVALNQAAPAGGATVSISSSTSALSVPASVTAAAGTASATFTAAAGTISSNVTAGITGTSNGSSQTTYISLLAATVVGSVSCSPTNLSSGGTSACTVTLSQAASSGGVAVAVSSNNASLSVPASVNVASGATLASFTATAGTIATSQTAVVTASCNGSSQTTSISLISVAPTYSISGTVTSSGSAVSGVTISLSPGPSTSTNASGSYSFSGLTAGQNYTVTPSLAGDTFSPQSVTFNNLSQNQTANFTDQETQAINFGALSNQALGTPPLTVNATASSGLPVSFNSQTTSVCTVSGATVTLVGAGTCTIQATQAGNSTYAAAPPVNQSLQVTSATSSPVVLSIAESHTGNFAQGQNGAVYTVTVSNGAGAGTASGTVTVTENVPAGLTLVSVSGNGWSCSGNACARSDALGAGSSYPSITVTVNVASNAPASVTNSVTVSGGSDPNSHSISDVTSISPPFSLNQNDVWFGATNNGSVVTGPQTVQVTAPPGVSWTTSSDLTFMVVSPSSGVGSGIFTIGIQDNALPSPENINGTVAVTANGASNSPQYVNVSLNVINIGTAAPPFGSFDTPANDTTGLAGDVAVTGWALDTIGVQMVQIWRDPVGGETPGSNGLILVGNAVFVPEARPDVQALYPNYPLNNAAGWGYMMLTNGLPNNGGSAGTGNGTYTLHAIATSIDGNTVELGTKTITCDNAAATTPFGTIDTPGEGATVSGTIVNFGWALTPQPYIIPTDGSTIWITVDGQNLGHPVYNQYRSDIATGFPGYNNTDGAVGYFYLDTTTLSNGMHNIGWLVTDNAGRTNGVGSRFFWVLN